MTPAQSPAARHRIPSANCAYFDGNRPHPRDVRLHLDEAAEVLEISFLMGDAPPVLWPLGEIRVLRDTAGGGAVLRWTGDPLARLHLHDTGLLAALPQPRRRAPPPRRARLAAWAAGAVLAVAVQIAVLIPLLADRLATFVPPAGERALGEATLGQIRQALAGAGLPPLATCDAPEGHAALARMLRALGADPDAAGGPTLLVLDHEMVNAFALPGGFVVLFDGLIDAAHTPEEVAAVVAHELGHVASRDPTRHALRSAGSIGILGLLLGDFAGGAAVLMLTERLISAHYSQTAESAADAYATAALNAAGVSPAALGDMFERLRAEHGDAGGFTAHFLSHPTLGSRIDAARAAADPARDYGSILGAADWAALQGICD